MSRYSKAMYWMREIDEPNDDDKLELIAHRAIAIYAKHDEAADWDAGFDAGEFSGPAHATAADREVEELAKKYGLTFEEVTDEINRIVHADEGPFGRNE